MKFLLNNQDVTPVNYEEIELVIDKTREGSINGMNLTELIFVNEARQLIENHLQSNGHFVGIPLDIQLDNGFNLEYYLDTSDNPKYQDHQTQLTVKKRNTNAEFWEMADSTIWALVSNPGVWEYEVGRVVITTDKQLELLGFGLTLLDIAKTIIDLFYSIQSISAAAGGITTIIYAVLMIVVYIVKLLNAINEIVIFLNKFLDYVNPPIDKLKANSIRKLIEQGLNGLNFGLVDNVFINKFNSIVYLGTTYKSYNKNNLFFGDSTYTHVPDGYPSSRDIMSNMKYDYTTVGGFMRWFLDVFNAKIRIENNFATIVRRDENFGTTQNISTGLTIQNKRVSEYTPNTNEAWQRCLVNFKLDDSDPYTSYAFDDSAYERSTVQAYTPLNLIKGFKHVDVGFGQGFHYEYTPGGFIKLIKEIKTKLAGFIGNNYPPLLNQIEYGTISYKNILVTDKFTYNTPRILRHIGGLRTQNVTAEEIFLDYHEIDFIGNNSFLIYSGEITECNDDLFVSLNQNDYAEINGVICEIVRVSYSPYSHKASIIYKQPSDYANNLTLQ